MDDSDILARIRKMVDAEHELRRTMQDNPGEVGDAAARLHDLEESLDQCWDLLRQRRAHRELHKIRMSRRRDLGSRSSDTSSDRASLTPLTEPASVEKRPLSRPDVLI
jgi:Protein of unknown function (DUF2630)